MKQVDSGPPDDGVGWAAVTGGVVRAAGWLDLAFGEAMGWLGLALGEATDAVGFCDVTMRRQCTRSPVRDMGS